MYVGLIVHFYLVLSYTLIPVTKVQLGEPATLLCDLPKTEFSRRVDWYKQSPGDTLQRIWTVKDSAAPAFAPEFNNSKWDVKYDKKLSNLTILRTRQEDEGMYHCGFTAWLQDTKWTATYLYVWSIAPPGGSVTLHCSLLSNFDDKTCSGGLSMFWFREGSNPSHPSIIYTDGNRHHECGNSSATQQSCVYEFNKSISSSDSGTYYCAVATCGKILLGKGTKLQGTVPFGFTFIVISLKVKFKKVAGAAHTPIISVNLSPLQVGQIYHYGFDGLRNCSKQNLTSPIQDMAYF
uniref:Ig-like domain-containing protein n=1 Tax=Oreochromis aureus TaxID=47969 RepID=A0AAZ1XRZ9_OREAU